MCLELCIGRSGGRGKLPAAVDRPTVSRDKPEQNVEPYNGTKRKRAVAERRAKQIEHGTNRTQSGI
jgi:hypothetical protein